MAYTYLITGATSDVGRALMPRLLRGAPGALILAQGCPPKAALQNIPYYIIAVWTWREEKYTK